MFIRNYRDVVAEDVEENAQGVTVRWVISQEDGAPNFVMRVFGLDLDGYTPFHEHEWEHEVFVLSGEGVVLNAQGTENPIRKGDIVFIPGNEKHQFKNTGEQLLEFICLIPITNSS